MKNKLLCLLLFVVIVDVCHSQLFSFESENIQWRNIFLNDKNARNFLGPYIFFDKAFEDNCYMEIENQLNTLESDWFLLIERNFYMCSLTVDVLTSLKRNVTITHYEIDDRLHKKVFVLKNYSLSKLKINKENFHYCMDTNATDESQYYLFIKRNGRIYSYAYYGLLLHGKTDTQIRKIQKKIDKNVYELIKYLLTL